MEGFNLANISDLYYGNAQCDAIYYGSTEIWSRTHDYATEYLTIESLADNNTIGWYCNGTTKDISYSIDGGNTWHTIYGLNGSNITIATINTGDKILIKGTSSTYGTGSTYAYFTSTYNLNIYGNIMSMLYGDNFIGQTTINSSSTFTYLFNGIQVVDASNLVLPATTLTSYCYQYMFYGCYRLTKAPELPATTLANGCYYRMFNGCIALTAAPELPATTLTSNCYYGMFQGCTSLTTAPELPATRLSMYCYRYMFTNCTALTTAPELPATTLMTECYYGMFYNCTSLTTAPELPAITLATDCYSYMFLDCSSLNYIKAMFTTDITSSTLYTNDWVDGVAASGTFVKNHEATWNRVDASGIPTGWTVETFLPYEEQYLTFESLEDNNTIGWYGYGTAKDISYSIDGGNTWNTVTGVDGSDVTIATINTGEKILFKGTNSAYGESNIYTYFTSTYNLNIYGNIMSLIYGDNFSQQTSISSTYTFYELFKNIKVVDASNLVLPATTLTGSCYRYMFLGCTSLTNGPVLPATTLTYSCYSGMFSGCTSLTTAPKLPATTLASYCYEYMFSDCTSLATAPKLPATTLTSACYADMFNGCRALVEAPELPATTLTNGCYREMFKGCTSLVEAPELPATTLAIQCYQKMFAYCTSLATAPELPAETLKDNCYEGMFSGCTSLVEAPELPATTLTYSCYSEMFYGCTSLTTAPELPATTLAYSCYNGMFSGCSNLNYIKAMFTTDISYTTSYTQNWVYGVAATGTFVKNYEATWTNTGINGIPTGWTVKKAGAETKYLTFESLEDNNTIGWRGDGIARDISYSIDDGATWTTVTGSARGDVPIATINTGEKILFKGTNSAYAEGDNNYLSNYTGFTSTGNLNIYGNIMSLIYGDNFIGQITITASNTFRGLFNQLGVVNASNLILPATTLTTNCYELLFDGCTSLTAAPELPATTLNYTCYGSMFHNCTALTTAPELPATTLADGCYYWMFYGCTSLATVPALPATTLASTCCMYMFCNCTSLRTAPALPATTITYRCYRHMFNGCTSLTTAPELPATILDIDCSECYAGMFSGCTSLTTAPALPLTTLDTECYANMFFGCTSLTRAPELPALTLATGCYNGMFTGCSNLRYIKAMFTTDISSTDIYTENWVDGVAATGTFRMNENAEWTKYGVSGIPTNWIITTQEPYEEQYLTFESLEDNNNIGWYGSSLARNMTYSVDGGNTWTTITGVNGSNVILATLNTGDKILFKQNYDRFSNAYNRYTRFTTSATVKAYGNIMSLSYGDNFIGQTAIRAQWAFKSIFSGTKITDASNLILPATSLQSHCYECMFMNCSQLTTAPTLPAATLVTSCYNEMFRYCSNLNYIKAMFTTTPGSSYTSYWVQGVAASGTFIKNANASWSVTGVYGVPSGWTIEIE